VLDGFSGGPTYDWSDRIEPLDMAPGAGFAVQWTGKVEAPLSEPFIFSVYVRGEARLWIDGQEVVFARSDRSERFDSQPMPLEAGRRYDIRLEFVSILTAPKVSLNWESPSQDRQRIPTPYLYP